MEIERKFLLKVAPEKIVQSITPTAIKQGYIVCEQERELRIRKRDTQFTLTQKSGNGLIREENETTISADAFTILWPFTEDRQISKLRYTFDYNGQECELDIYRGKLEGLLVMEAEFSNEAEAVAFIPPEYCVKEITEDKTFKNANLARLSNRPVE